MPDLKLEIMMKRQNEKAYTTFCETVLPMVIGKNVWRHKCYTQLLSEYVSVSDEAFALLLLENSWEMWKHQAEQDENKTTVFKTKYTVHSAGTKKNHGWTREGLMRFIALVEEVKKDRNKNGGEF